MASKKVTRVVKRRSAVVRTVSKTRDDVDEALDAAAARAKAAPLPKPAKPKGPPPVATKHLSDLVEELVDKTGPAAKKDKDGKAKAPAGPGRATILGDGAAVRLPGVISTQSESLDAAIGRGGWPMGRLTTLTSDTEAASKTTLLLHGIAEAQQMGGFGLLIEKENKLDESLVHAVGVGPALVISKPPYLERAFDVIHRTVDKVKRLRDDLGRVVPCFIGVDSLDGFDVKDEYDLDISERYANQPIAPVPKVMSRNLPKLSEILEHEHIACVWICQSRSKVNVRFGKQTDQTGGKALKFHSALIVNVANVGKLKRGKEDIGIRVKAMVGKNNIARPYMATEFRVVWGRGVDRNGDLLTFATTLDVVEKSGAWYSFRGERIASGIDAAVDRLDANPVLAAKIREETREAAAAARRAGRALARPMTSEEKTGVDDDVSAEDGGDA